MDALLDKISNLNYELFGLIFPGFLALLGIVYFGGIGFYIIEEFSFSNFTNTFETIYRDYTFVLFIGLLIFSYLSGHVLKWISKDGIWKLLPPLGFVQNKLPRIETVWIRFFLLAGDTNPVGSNHRDSFKKLKDALAKKLSSIIPIEGMDETLEDWDDFYFISKSYIGQSDTKNLLANYQNKYTFHRSLASLFSILIWISLGNIIIIWKSGVAVYMILVVGAHAFLAYLLLRNFVASYVSCWKLFGDVVVAELVVELKRQGEI